MSDPNMKNLKEAFALNKSFEPNKVDFLFHLIYDIYGRPISPSIIPIYKNQLALIQEEGVKK